MIDCAIMRRLILIIALIAFLAWNGQASAQLSVTSWNLVTAVQDFTQEIPQDYERSETVTNPFQASQSAMMSTGGTAATEYDFSWVGDNASFHVDMSHLTPDLGNDFYRSLSSGDIYFTTGVPLIAHLTGSYTYFLPAPGMRVGVAMRMKDVREASDFFDEPRLADTILSPAPQSGTFTWDRTVLIPANSQCNILYDFQLNARRNSGALATGSGSFTLTFDPVPEPATLATLILALAAAFRPRRRCKIKISA